MSLRDQNLQAVTILFVCGNVLFMNFFGVFHSSYTPTNSISSKNTYISSPWLFFTQPLYPFSFHETYHIFSHTTACEGMKWLVYGIWLKTEGPRGQ